VDLTQAVYAAAHGRVKPSPGGRSGDDHGGVEVASGVEVGLPHLGRRC